MNNTETKTITKALSEVENGKIFKVGDVEYIKFFDENGQTAVMTKNIIFRSRFGNNNNLAESQVLKKMQEDFLPKVIEAIGEENICEFETDLTTLDGLKPYKPLMSKISLPTFDFYRKNVEIFDKYKIEDWFWLATPESANPHCDPRYVLCVGPSGIIGYNDYDNYGGGVRPFLYFVSSISVSCEE